MAAVLAVAATPFIRGDEARAATTFTVTSAVDASDAAPGNGVCETSVAGQCTLRAAIEEANALAGVDTINFNIPGATPLAPATILPSTPLPSIGEAVTIDGYSQPSASANTLAVGNDAGIAIALQGSPVSTGLSVAAGPTVIRGLSVVNFSAQAITVSSGAGVTIAGNFIGLNPNGTFVGNFTGVRLTVGANNVSIGGSTPADRNVISGNTQDGISVAAVTGLAVRGNYIGTSLSGTAELPNVRFGLLLGGSGAQIGGLTAGDRNVISGNGQEGMRVSGSTNTIVGNYIGTTANGLTALGNQDGIFVSNGGIINSAIGNGTVAGRNVISGNRRSGIQHGPLGSRTTIRGNWIGVASDGSSPLGNNTASLGGAGILVTASGLMPLAATIGGNNAGDANIIANTIAGPGVQVNGAQLTGAKIVGNTIFNNSGLGIAFGSGVNPPLVLNDVNDADSGPNNLQNHPVITSAAITGPNLNISYSIDSLPGNSDGDARGDTTTAAISLSTKPKKGAAGKPAPSNKQIPSNAKA